MDKLLKFMEYGCIDNKLYWRIPGLDSPEQYEFQWRKDHPMAWRYRKLGDALWKLSSTHHLTDNLKNDNIDMATLETKVRYSVLQQVAFADRLIKDARKAFGRETVDQAIWDNQVFLEQLEQAVMRLTQEGKASESQRRLTLVKE